MSDYTPFERLGVRNGLNKVVCPFVEGARSNLVEAKLCLDRPEPNVAMALRRLKNLETLVENLEAARTKWNEEL